MSYSREINTVSIRIDSARGIMNDRSTRFKNELNDLGSWWKGEGGKSLGQKYGQIDAEINQLKNHLGHLQDELRQLASEVDRADEERRVKAQLEKKKKGK